MKGTLLERQMPTNCTNYHEFIEKKPMAWTVTPSKMGVVRANVQS